MSTTVGTWSDTTVISAQPVMQREPSGDEGSTCTHRSRLIPWHRARGYPSDRRAFPPVECKTYGRDLRQADGAGGIDAPAIEQGPMDGS